MAARSAGAAGEPTGESGIADATALEAALQAMHVGDEGAPSPLPTHGASLPSEMLLTPTVNDDVNAARCARCAGRKPAPYHAAAMRCFTAAAVQRR